MIALLDSLVTDPGQLWWIVPCLVGGVSVWLIRSALKRRKP